jgi:hypothetical protein
MADNVGYTEGSGKTIAADDVGGVLYQRIKPVVGEDGTAVDVSASNPMPISAYGELIEAIEALRMALNSVSRGIHIPDELGRSRCNVEVLPTVATVTTLTNVSQIGTNPAEPLIASAMFAGSASLRNNISVS